MLRFFVALAVMLFAVSALAGKPVTSDIASSRQTQSTTEERLVFVTGSLIPQRVKVRRVGTTTFSPLRVIDRQEIDQTGRQTTPGAFVNEPSVRIIGH